MKSVDYVTFVTPTGEGTGLRYTDYVIPSGTGTRIVENVAPLFSIETGEDLLEDALSEMRGPTTEFLQNYMDRLAEMSDLAATSSSSV